MRVQGTIRRAGRWTAYLAWPLGIAAAWGPGPSRAQAPAAAPAAPAPGPAAAVPAPVAPAPGGAPAPTPAAPGGVVLESGVGMPMLPPQIQVVRFQVPEGVQV